MDSNKSKRLALVKYLFQNGSDLLSHKKSLSNALAILNFHDASEQFLLIIADKLEFNPPNNYMDYWEMVAQRNHILPNKTDMSKLNRMRVSFKHHGIFPVFEDCEEIRNKLLDFFITTSKNLLNIDFTEIRLTDLIEDEEIKKHLKEADLFLKQEKFKDSITSSAIAFVMFGKKIESDLLEKKIESHPFLLNFKRDSIIAQDSTLDENFSKVKRCFEDLYEKINILLKDINYLFLGIDPYTYQKFTKLTPLIEILRNEQILTISRWSEYKNSFNMNERNASFCITFVINSVLKYQESSFELMNLHKSHRIKIKSESADVFSFINNQFKKIVVIKEGKIIEEAKISHLIKQKKYYWEINYEEKVGYLEMEDIEWIGEHK